LKRVRVLVFRHVPFEGIGLIGRIFNERNVEVDYADLYRSDAALPDVSAYDALIFLGGPMSVNDDLPYLAREIEWIREAVAQRRHVLGICLGAQLIARAMGATVRSNGAKEIGWYKLRFTEAAAKDPLFEGLSCETVFHWHGETFDLPSGAELFASSDLCRNQAFRLGDRVYALQFHLEVTPDMIADWCKQDDNCGDMRELDITIDPYYNSRRLEELSCHIFRRWSELVHSSR
jgi:GMP synthase-like glutamine amidotransferase